MPWKVRARACKQKSTGKPGTHVNVKVKSDGKEEQVSCHTSETKAQAALRAKYASESLIRTVIRELILEFFQKKSL